MSSVARSLLWEFWSQTRWGLAAAALGTAAVPALLLHLLRNQHALEPDEKGLEMLHFVWIACEALALISVVIGTRRRLTHLHALPIPNMELTFWQLTSSLIFCAAAFLVVAAGLNAIYGINWPLWGPAMFIGVTCVAAQTAFWLGGRSLPLQIISIAGFTFFPGLWLRSHYGLINRDPTHYWTEVTSSDFFTAVAALIVLYGLAHSALARDRRGDAPNFLRWRQAFERWMLQRQAAVAIPSTPIRAQFWFEWTQKGLALPLIMIILQLVFLAVWLWDGAPAEVVPKAFEAIGAAFCIVSFVVGLLLGYCGRANGDPHIGGFLASRPISDTALALSVLQTTGRSVLISWVLWAVVRVAFLLSVAPGSFRTGTEEFWLHLSVLLGVWTAAAIPACAVLTGRTRVCAGLLLGIAGLLIGQTLFVRTFVPQAGWMAVDRGLACFDAIVCVVVAIWMFVAALRRGLLGVLAVVLVAVAWGGLIAIGGAALIASFDELRNGVNLFLVLLACGTALSLVPIAAAPLAVSWNRHR
jgi:hypothetical protein